MSEELLKLIDDTLAQLKAMQMVLMEVARITAAEKKPAQGKGLITLQEKQILLEHQICPDCGSTTFYVGPKGGQLENIKCVKCGSKFNICPPFFAERI